MDEKPMSKTLPINITTLPSGTYRVYTTFADTSFRLMNNETIYFKGGSVI